MEQTYFDSPLGPILLTAEGDRLTGAEFDKKAEKLGDSPVLRQAENWLLRYFAGENPDPAELKLAPRGTAFQEKVWELLGQIPYGQTTSYGALAKKLSVSMSAQAIGGAVGKNPIVILVPCHRVVGADGGLTGFAAGLDRKRFLLELENR